MKKDIFPIEVKGSWVWNNDEDESIEEYLFFRKELALDGTPGYADLWISANTSFHVYVNGRHVFYGPAPRASHVSYAHQMDITFCLQTGKNVISVLVHNTKVPRYSHVSHQGGLWVQGNLYLFSIV